MRSYDLRFAQKSRSWHSFQETFHKSVAKAGSTCCKIQNKTIQKCRKPFKISPKWRKIAESGHTDAWHRSALGKTVRPQD